MTYVDGTVVHQDTSLGDGRVFFNLGGRYNGGHRIDGVIDNVFLAFRTLDLAEIDSICEAGNVSEISSGTAQTEGYWTSYAEDEVEWVEVELLQPSLVTHVTVYPRTDCCQV